MAPRGAPLDGVFLGGAGFTLPRYLLATRRGSRARVHEVDGELVELARERLGLRTGRDLRVVEGDARVTLAGEATASADLLVGDAFGARAIPWHLSTVEYAREIRRVLRPRGRLRAQRHRPAAAGARPRRGRDAARGVRRRGARRAAQRRRPARPAATSSCSPPTTALPRGVRSASRGARTYDRRATARFAAGAEPLRDLDAPADQLLSGGQGPPGQRPRPTSAAQPLHRERRLRERPDRQVHQRERVVVAGDAVQAHGRRTRRSGGRAPIRRHCGRRRRSAPSSRRSPRRGRRARRRRGAGSTGRSGSGCGAACPARPSTRRAGSGGSGRCPGPRCRTRWWLRWSRDKVEPPGKGSMRGRKPGRAGGWAQPWRRDVRCSVAAVIDRCARYRRSVPRQR